MSEQEQQEANPEDLIYGGVSALEQSQEEFDHQLRFFLNQVEIYVSLELGGKTSSEDAYLKIKESWKELKALRKNIKQQEQVISAVIPDEKPKRDDDPIPQDDPQ